MRTALQVAAKAWRPPRLRSARQLPEATEAQYHAALGTVLLPVPPSGKPSWPSAAPDGWPGGALRGCTGADEAPTPQRSAITLIRVMCPSSANWPHRDRSDARPGAIVGGLRRQPGACSARAGRAYEPACTRTPDCPAATHWSNGQPHWPTQRGPSLRCPRRSQPHQGEPPSA